ncbi:hypothetical protein AeMF1_006071 [Aphanomyces euteiches]|nr:hypothetical protein AeMF1_006071 [Aphanomyces euteiches]
MRDVYRGQSSQALIKSVQMEYHKLMEVAKEYTVMENSLSAEEAPSRKFLVFRASQKGLLHRRTHTNSLIPCIHAIATLADFRFPVYYSVGVQQALYARNVTPSLPRSLEYDFETKKPLKLELTTRKRGKPKTKRFKSIGE